MSAHNLKCFMWFILFLVDTILLCIGLRLGWFEQELFYKILMLVTTAFSIWQIFQVKDVNVSINK